MRNLSRKAQQAMESRRDFYASAEITFADNTKKTLGRSDFSLSGNTVIDSAESNSFPLGILASKRVTLSLMNDDERWSEYDFYGAKIFLQTKFDLDDGTTETLNIGTFTVVTPESYGTVISVTAMDDSYKTDKDYSTSLSYPVFMGVALNDSCTACGITQIGDVPNSDYLIPSAPENVTHRQFIGLCAMIAGGNAKFDEYNRLKIVPYDFTNFERFEGWDGGTFAPWTKGDVRDGGTFNPWNDGDSADGGQFGDRDNVHVLYEFASGMTIDVDDVVITGVQMDGKDADNNTVTHLFGEEGYVLSLDNRLAVGKEDEALGLIGAKIVGLRFRPFTGDHIALPTAEFMDLAMIVDWKQNVYQTVLTDVTFNYFGFTGLKCAADSPIRNSSKYYGREAKAIIEARQMVQKEKTERDLAVEQLANKLAHSSGLYMTAEGQEDKSTIYYMHDKPTLEESMIVWKLTAEAFGISTDGGKTYPYGLDATGVAILDRIYAIGLNADYIKTGAFEIVKDGKVMVLMDKDTGEVILRPDTFELSDGSTIGSIAEDKASTAANNAVNDFVSKTYNPKIAELQKQLDGQIETHFYDHEPTLENEPAASWKTEDDKERHEGDLFFNRTTGYSYRFFRKGTSWGWELVQDTDVTKALAQAAQAQATADGKARVFYRTPQPPYDLYDLWAQGTGGDIMICVRARQSGEYDASDWTKSNDYIDRAIAQTITNNALSEFFESEFQPMLDALKEQADKKSENWYQEKDPLEEWIYLQDSNGNTLLDSSNGKLEDSSSSNIKKEHTNDLWYNTTEQKIYYWDGTKWNLSKTDVPDELFDKIDGKAQIFISQPVSPYQQGDLWFNSTTSDIMTCITSRESGNYVASDWQKRNKYIDQSAADKAASDAVEGQTQDDIFNKLTDNGKTKGIILKNGELYVNATYINTGIFKVSKDGKTMFSVNIDTGDVEIVAKSFSLTSGDTIEDIAQQKVDAQTQEDIFNKLTNNKQLKGIYMENGELYINASYLHSGTMSADRIQGGTLKLGGNNNSYGYFSVLDSKGVERISISSVGISIKEGTTINMDGKSGGIIKNCSIDTCSVRYPGLYFGGDSSDYKGRILSSTIQILHPSGETHNLLPNIIPRDNIVILDKSAVVIGKDYETYGEVNILCYNNKVYIAPELIVDNDLTVGGSVRAGNNVIQTSDARLKNNITPISAAYEQVFEQLRPVAYRFNSGDRVHTGFISQDVEETLNNVGLTAEDWGAFCKDTGEDGEDIYGMRYSEIIALNTHMIQKLMKRVDELEARIRELEGR